MTLGRSRRIVAIVGHFLVVPHILARTDAVATVPSRLGLMLAEPAGVRSHEPPLALRQWSEMLIWSRATDRSPLPAWFRTQLLHLARA